MREPCGGWAAPDRSSSKRSNVRRCAPCQTRPSNTRSGSRPVHPDYHIEVLHSFYSVPYRLIGRKVDVRLTHRMIEIFHNHERVAVHHRRGQRGGHTTIKEHMPK